MMPKYARIKLTSANLEQLERVAKSIREIADKTGVRVKGPQPLPT
ncbi:MAG: 30S ribosomal protein S10, partial [Nitrososphaerales archaeon]